MQPLVHAVGAWCGRKVPGGDFCPQNGPPAWTKGASASLRGARWLFPLYSQLLYLVALLLGHYEEGDSEFFAAGAKAPYGVG